MRTKLNDTIRCIADRNSPDYEARQAAAQLLATESVTEDALTKCIFEFAKSRAQYVAQSLIDATITDVTNAEEELYRLREALIKHAPNCQALYTITPADCRCFGDERMP